MKTITWFENAKDLQELTGLEYMELWDAGFNMDDWDFGFCTDEELDLNAYDYMDFKCGYYYLMKALVENNRAFEPKHTEYNGKHYYMCYHS